MISSLNLYPVLKAHYSYLEGSDLGNQKCKWLWHFTSWCLFCNETHTEFGSQKYSLTKYPPTSPSWLKEQAGREGSRGRHTANWKIRWREDSAWVYVVSILDLTEIPYGKHHLLHGFSHQISAASAYLWPLVRLGPIADSIQNLASNSPWGPRQIPYSSEKEEGGKERLVHPDLPAFLAAIRESSDKISDVERCWNPCVVWTMLRVYPLSAAILILLGYTLTRGEWGKENVLRRCSLWPSHVGWGYKQHTYTNVTCS